MDFLSEKCKKYSPSLRIVRIEIAPGIYENLITNLPDIDFDMDELKELYHLRWDWILFSQTEIYDWIKSLSQL